MAGGPIHFHSPNPSSGDASSVLIGFRTMLGFISGFAADASWYMTADVPETVPTGTPYLRILVCANATSGNFQFDCDIIDITPDTTDITGKARTQESTTTTITFVTTALKIWETKIEIDNFTVTSGDQIELELVGLTASTVAADVGVEASIIWE